MEEQMNLFVDGLGGCIAIQWTSLQLHPKAASYVPIFRSGPLWTLLLPTSHSARTPGLHRRNFVGSSSFEESKNRGCRMTESGILVMLSPTKYAYSINQHKRASLLLTREEALNRL